MSDPGATADDSATVQWVSVEVGTGRVRRWSESPSGRPPARVTWLTNDQPFEPPVFPAWPAGQASLPVSILVPQWADSMAYWPRGSQSDVEYESDVEYFGRVVASIAQVFGPTPIVVGVWEGGGWLQRPPPDTATLSITARRYYLCDAVLGDDLCFTSGFGGRKPIELFWPPTLDWCFAFDIDLVSAVIGFRCAVATHVSALAGVSPLDPHAPTTHLGLR